MRRADRGADTADGYQPPDFGGLTSGLRGATLRPTGIVVFATVDRGGPVPTAVTYGDGDFGFQGDAGVSGTTPALWHDTEPSGADRWRQRALRPMTWLLGR
jgi:hypothetical protein